MDHLDYCRDEFTFLLNRHESKERGNLFDRPVQRFVQMTPVSRQRVAAD